MRKGLFVLFALACGIGLALWLLRDRPSSPQAIQAPASTISNGLFAEKRPLSDPVAAPPPVASVPSNTPVLPNPPAASNSLPAHPATAPPSISASATPAPSEPMSTIPPEVLLENMRTTLRQYGLMFGGNPVGTNPEITQALNGENPKQIKFLGPDGNRINGKGELVDAWGTPYFFHQLSAMETEIRSAGPDKTMWTADDLVIK